MTATGPDGPLRIMATRVARGPSGAPGVPTLADLVAAVRRRGRPGSASRPPRLRGVPRIVRVGQPFRVTTEGPSPDGVSAIAVTPSGRVVLPVRVAGSGEIELQMPPGSVRGAEMVQIWLSRDGLAEGPAVVRVTSGPIVHRAEVATGRARRPLVRLVGEGFGSDASRVTVELDARSHRPRVVSDDRIDLETEPVAGLHWVLVRVGDESSEPVLVRFAGATGRKPVA